MPLPLLSVPWSRHRHQDSCPLHNNCLSLYAGMRHIYSDDVSRWEKNNRMKALRYLYYVLSVRQS
ncbi:hypothetical protein EVA_14662 [gut metagenome]|uniref:Uncharacterized protein n=1 Tax=gut metagenome TaxID=749906 RepID=J9FQK8_9ZZZZ